MPTDLTTNPRRWTLLQQVVRRVLAGPPWVVRRLAGPTRVNADGMVLSAPVQVYARLSALLPETHPEREQLPGHRRQTAALMALGMPRRRDVRSYDRRVPTDAGEVPVRVFRPVRPGARRPAIVYFHGGGWAVGNIDSHSGSCEHLAAVADAVVISVDYRLAPEDPFPAGLDDCLAAYAWVLDHADELDIDPERVGVMGDSAGGNLAAVVALESTRQGRPPRLQGLVYPATDMHFVTPSHDEFATRFVLTRNGMTWYRTQYRPDPSDWSDPLVSPKFAPDLTGAPRALVFTAGFDPLRDEGANYATALRDAGVDVTYRCYDDQVHGFFGMGIFPGVLPIIDEVCTLVGEALRA